jgi:hypothetical protein
MTEGWQRIGRLFEPTGQADWLQTHAALPTVLETSGDRVTLLCAGRDSQGRGNIGSIEVSLLGNTPPLIAPQPLLAPGQLGAFDDAGVLPACVVTAGDRKLLYYTGVMLGKSVPFYYAIGLAVCEGDAWTRVSSAPLLDRNAVDPLLTASPCVLFDEGRFRMWYVSGVRWEARDDGPRHYYNIRYAESHDGLHWEREGLVCIDFKPGEYALARPCVRRDADRYRMWFPYRGERYRIGYAESDDGLTWVRNDDAIRFVGNAQPWESEMQCYPWVFDAEGARWMLYNGNGYGSSGFGIAREVRG